MHLRMAAFPKIVPLRKLFIDTELRIVISCEVEVMVPAP
jgi:hypothetical protein